MVEGLFVISNGYGRAFSPDKRAACNEVHAAADLAAALSLSAVVLEDARLGRQTVGRAHPGVLAIHYLGQRSGDDRVVHGTVFIDDNHRAGFSAAALAELGDHAEQVTLNPEDSYCRRLPDHALGQIAAHGYYAGEDGLAEVLPLPQFEDLSVLADTEVAQIAN